MLKPVNIHLKRNPKKLRIKQKVVKLPTKKLAKNQSINKQIKKNQKEVLTQDTEESYMSKYG